MAVADDRTVRAWQEYLNETRNLIGFKYDEVEPWAWKRLLATLKLKPRKVTRRAAQNS